MRKSIVNFMLVGTIGLYLCVSPLRADLLVGAPGDSGVGDCIPFGCSDAGRYQQIFDSSLFSGPTTIDSLTFFLRNFDNTDPVTGGPLVADTIYPATYSIVLATVPEAVDTLDPILDNNLNSDPSLNQLFFVGTLSTPVSDHFTISTTPANYFHYDPSQGNLLMDIESVPTDPLDLDRTVFLDVNSASGGLFSSAYDTNPNPSGCADSPTSCLNPDAGLVVQFGEVPVVPTVPEPSPLWLLTGSALLPALRLLRQRIDRAGRRGRGHVTAA